MPHLWENNWNKSSENKSKQYSRSLEDDILALRDIFFLLKKETSHRLGANTMGCKILMPFLKQ